MVKYMKEKIAVSTDELGTHVDDSLHNGLEQIMLELSPRIEKQYLKGTFHRLFWEQQLQDICHSIPHSDAGILC